MTVNSKSLMFVVHCEVQETALVCDIFILRGACNSNATKWMMKFNWTNLTLLSIAHEMIHTGILSQRLLWTNDPVLLNITERKKD